MPGGGRDCRHSPQDRRTKNPKAVGARCGRCPNRFQFSESLGTSLGLEVGADHREARFGQRLTRRVSEDVQAVLPSVVEHRLRESSDFSDHVGTALAQRLLSHVDVIG